LRFKKKLNKRFRLENANYFMVFFSCTFVSVHFLQFCVYDIYSYDAWHVVPSDCKNNNPPIGAKGSLGIQDI